MKDLPVKIDNLSFEEAIQIQKLLKNKGYYTGEIDGIVGPLSKDALSKFKKDSYLEHPSLIGESTLEALKEQTTSSVEVDSSQPAKVIYQYPTNYGNRTSVCLVKNHIQTKLTEKDYEKLALLYNLNTATIKAVVAVETSGGGFLSESGPMRPKILFEGYQFYRLTPEPVSLHRPDLSQRYYSREYYKGGSAEWQRLLDAIEWDEEAALQAASWGLGQVLGLNYKIAGCSSIQEFVEQAFTDEYHQVIHMLEFAKSNNLIAYLQNQEWDNFARRYNGPLYKQNRYAVKLQREYVKYAS